MNTNKNDKEHITFNTPFELGLRALTILSAISPSSLDVQRLLFYDYLIIYSSDIKNGPPSIHPHTPHRSGGLIIRRKILQEGLNIMYSKSLLDIVYDHNGITYKSSELTLPFLKLINSNYLTRLQVNTKWITEQFSAYSNDELKNYIDSNLVKWGGEFDYEYLIRGEEKE
ncbi:MULTISPECIES: ABC-three component system middle component 2 [Bacillus cereus group]|uniref:Threonine transporter n=1 Tax=Bacillus thuringiensis TaxID=1428 RepID=A0A9X7GC54_BACTU|nr:MULTISPECIES: ABC-three component system middle component 2 [Bacillus cereus group]PFV28044.1 hypothetical protein COK99_22010 [Bacillus thuringiensis]PGW70167.1 hypothetical protein COE26_09170 [Bacillus cereus]